MTAKQLLRKQESKRRTIARKEARRNKKEYHILLAKEQREWYASASFWIGKRWEDDFYDDAMNRCGRCIEKSKDEFISDILNDSMAWFYHVDLTKQHL